MKCRAAEHLFQQIELIGRLERIIIDCRTYKLTAQAFNIETETLKGLFFLRVFVIPYSVIPSKMFERFGVVTEFLLNRNIRTAEYTDSIPK